MQKEAGFLLNYTVRIKPPFKEAVFAAMKDEILGKNYSLSVAIVGKKRMFAINKTYRKIAASTDILSFPLSKTEGQIFLNPDYTKKEAKKFGRSYENFIYFLFIHGCVHLKGYAHGGTMERIETAYRKRFKI